MLTLYRYAPPFLKNKYAFLWLAKLTNMLKAGYRLADAINLLALDRSLVILTALRVNQRIAEDISQGVRLSDSLSHRNEHKYFPAFFWQIIREAENSDDFIGAIEKTIEKYDGDLINNPNTMKPLKDVINDFPPRKPVDFNLLVGDLPNAPVMRLVNMLLAQALRENASKILFVPEPKRFRVDIVINEKTEVRPSIPVKFAPEVVARIEIMAGLDYWKHYKQVGKFNFCVGSIHSDIEVTTEKTADGYKRADLNLCIKK